MRAIRKSKALTQEELAFRSGLDQSYISEVESALRNVSLENICRIANALDCEPAELLEGVPRLLSKKPWIPI